MREDDPAWQFFAALQNEADPQSIDRSLARGEALDVVLNEIVSDPTTDQNLLRKRFFSLCRNRLSKQNNRRALDRQRFRSTHRRGGVESGGLLLTAPAPTVFRDLAYTQLTDLIRTVLPEEELGLLIAIADGHNYGDMARNYNTTISGVKSKLFRVREKLRNSWIAPVLRSALQRGATRRGATETASAPREVLGLASSVAPELARATATMYSSTSDFTAWASQQ